MRESRQAVYSSYEEAAEEAERIRSSESRERLVTKVQSSPYGSGFVVRSFPVRFLLNPRMKPKTQTGEYRSL